MFHLPQHNNQEENYEHRSSVIYPVLRRPRHTKRGTVAQMSRNNMGNRKVTMLKTAVPPLTNDAEFFPGMPKNWGLTFMINEQQAPTGCSAGGLAWAGLANSYYWIDQQNGVVGVFLSQVLPFADGKALPLYYAFEKSVYQAMA
ncbi:MAG: hypothetical protein ABIQ03_12255 [Burkholderiales bacterium]